MPVSVKKVGDKYCVVEPGGKTVKCHATKAKAVKHAQAINMNTANAVDLNDGMQPAAPKLVIISDGTPNGSRVFVQGQELDPKRMDFYCRKPDPKSEYEFEREGECSFSMSVEQSDGEFAKTVTVRMRSQAEQEFVDAMTSDLPPEAVDIVRKALTQGDE